MARNTNIYSNARLNSYDSVTSSLSMRFFNNIGAIDLNPINPEFIGKQPKKGDKVYDYDNKLSVYISPNMAISLLKGIKTLKENNLEEVELKSVYAEHGDKKVTIYAPGQAKVRANKEIIDTEENFVIQLNNKDEAGVHILQNEAVVYTTTEGEQLEDTVYAGLEMIELFLQTIIDISMYGWTHATTLAGGAKSSGGTSGKSSAFANIADDDDDDDVYEEDEVPSKKTIKKKSMTKALADEFGDDDDE